MLWFFTNYKKIFFYRLPKNIIRREKWLLSIAPPDFVPSKWTAVCSEHFKEDSFFYLI
jgi:hypothetical protein